MDRQDSALASQSPRDLRYQWMGLPWNEWFVTASVICSTYIPHSEGAIHSVKLKSRAAWSGVNGMLRTPRSPGTGIIYNSPSNPFSFVSTWLLFRNIQNGNMSIFLNLDA